MKLTKTVFDLLVLLFLLILLLLILIQKNSSFFFDLLQKQILTDKAKKIYALSRGETSVDFISGKIIIKNFRLTLKKNRIRKEDKKSHRLTRIEIKKITIFGISWIDLILGEKIKATKTDIDGGEISYFYFPKREKQKNRYSKRKEVNFYSEFFNLKNINFIYSRGSFKHASLIMKNCNLKLKKILVKTSEFLPLSRSVSFSSPDFSSSQVLISLKKRSYFLSINSVKISSVNRSGILKNIYYYPEKFTGNPNYTVIRIKDIVLINHDIFSIPDEGTVIVDKIIIKKPEIQIYHNRIERRKRTNKKRTFPHDFFKKLKFGFEIGKIKLDNGVLTYTEKNYGEKKAESIFLTKINGEIKGLQNIVRSGSDDPYLSFNLTGRFMNKSNLDLTLKIPLRSGSDSYYFSGKLSGMNPAVLNRFLSRNTRIRIERGILDSLKFYIWANSNEATGDIYLMYRNLKISLLKRRNFQKKRKFYSFIANTIIRKNNNPKYGRFKKGKIYFLKKKNISFPHYIWKALLSGIKSSLGI